MIETETQSVYATILPFIGKQSVSHAVLTLLNEFDDPEFDPCFIQANQTYVPGVELLTAIRRINLLLGNHNRIASQVARELKDLFERPEFQEAIPVQVSDDDDIETLVDGTQSDSSGATPRRILTPSG